MIDQSPTERVYDEARAAVPGVDDVLLTDRFFLGEPQFRGFAIRGVGPRILTQTSQLDQFGRPILDSNGNITFFTDRNQVRDDAVGGRNYYLGRAELEIPLGSGARELGLRPSVFLDVGALFNVTAPTLQQSPFPGGLNFAIRDADGNPLFTQITAASEVNGVCTASATSTVTNPINPNPPSCLTSANNTALQQNIPPFREVFLGDTAAPRISIGIGVNWNSPFGPFRFDLAKALVKQPGDDPQLFQFNVGTAF